MIQHEHKGTHAGREGRQAVRGRCGASPMIFKFFGHVDVLKVDLHVHGRFAADSGSWVGHGGLRATRSLRLAFVGRQPLALLPWRPLVLPFPRRCGDGGERRVDRSDRRVFRTDRVCACVRGGSQPLELRRLLGRTLGRLAFCLRPVRRSPLRSRPRIDHSQRSLCTLRATVFGLAVFGLLLRAKPE